MENAYFEGVKATLSDLAKHTSEVVRPVIHNGAKVTLTDHGKEVAEIIPMPKREDRKKAWAILKSMGPLTIHARK